jgi:hypothetical protein
MKKRSIPSFEDLGAGTSKSISLADLGKPRSKKEPEVTPEDVLAKLEGMKTHLDEFKTEFFANMEQVHSKIERISNRLDKL